MARKGKVFNNLGRPKLLRKEIGLSETVVGLVLLASIVGMGAWFGLQRDQFDPSERDISLAVLQSDSVADTLYKTPLLPWHDPALGPVGAAASAPQTGKFPAAILDGGWTLRGSVQTFTDENLYEKINGQAEQYRKFGFVELTFATLQRGPLTLDLYLYDQASFANALGLFAEQRGARAVVAEGPVFFTPSTLGASGMVGQHVFHALGDDENPELAAKGKQIATALATLDAGGATPAPFLALNESMGIPFERVGFVSIDAFQFEFAKRFWFAGTGAGEERLFVHVAESEAAAQALFASFHAEQQEEYEVVESSEGSALYKHEFLKTFFALRTSGVHVYGIEEAAKTDGIPGQLQQLITALEPPTDTEEQ